MSLRNQPQILLCGALSLLLTPQPLDAQWRADGVPICSAVGAQHDLGAISDGAGGAIIVWLDRRAVDQDIYVQRVNAAGAIQWTVDGVNICSAPTDKANASIISDGAGGAIIAWNDFRNGSWDLFAQRFDASGVPQWTADGVVLSAAAASQFNSVIASDGAGGAIIAFEDNRAGSLMDIYAQRIDASGAAQWTANGVPVSTAPGAQQNQEIMSLSGGGAIITWEHDHINRDIYAQRIDASGSPMWLANGVALCTAAGMQMQPGIVSDEAGGAIVVWTDTRAGSPDSSDVFSQRIDASGVPQWAVNGVALSTAAGAQRPMTARL